MPRELPRPLLTLRVTIGVAIFCACALAILYVTAPAGDSGSVRWYATMIAASTLTVALVFSAGAWRGYGKYQRLTDGEGVMARWTVSAEEWRRFVHDEARRPKERGVPRNRLDWQSLEMDLQLEVRVSRDAVLVGDSFQSLHTFGMLPPRVTLSYGDPAVVEISMRSRGDEDNPEGALENYVLRFPVSRAAMSNAEQLVKEFATSVAAGRAEAPLQA